MTINIGVWGSKSNAGDELMRILSLKEGVTIFEVASRHDSYEKILGQIDYAALALPASESMIVAPRLYELGIPTVDLSGAFRLLDVKVFEQYYGIKHSCPQYIPLAVCGLTEKNRNEIKTAKLVDDPGCYSTAIEEVLLPLVSLKLISPRAYLDIRAVSGYSGQPKAAPIPKSITAYKPDREHKQVPEMEQVLGLQGQIHFFPSVAPWARGIEATVKVRIEKKVDIVDLYRDFYRPISPTDISYVRIVTKTELQRVIGTNYCEIAPKIDYQNNVTVEVAICNLGKGAAGQAVQNLIVMNSAFGKKVYENE